MRASEGGIQRWKRDRLHKMRRYCPAVVMKARGLFDEMAAVGIVVNNTGFAVGIADRLPSSCHACSSPQSPRFLQKKHRGFRRSRYPIRHQASEDRHMVAQLSKARSQCQFRGISLALETEKNSQETRSLDQQSFSFTKHTVHTQLKQLWSICLENRRHKSHTLTTC